MKRTAALAVLLSLAGSCTSKEEPPAPPPSSLDIGTTISIQGDLAGTGTDNRDAENLAVEEINAAGGVLGLPLSLRVENDKTTVEGAREAYAKLVDLGVPAIIGPSSSNQAQAIADLIATSRVVALGRTSTSPSLTALADDDYYFRLAPSDVYQAKLLARLLREAALERVCVVHRDDTYGRPFAALLEQEIAGTLAMTMVPYNPASPSLSTVLRGCDSLLCSQADGGGAACSTDDKVALVMITFVKDGSDILSQAGPWSSSKQRFYFTDGSRDVELVRLGRPLDGARGTLPTGPDTASPEGSERSRYQNAFAARFSRPAPAFTETAYDAVYVVAAALEITGKADGPALRTAMRQLADPAGVRVSTGDWKTIRDALRDRKGIRLHGASGALDFDANGDRKPPYYYRVWRIQGGESLTEKIEVVNQ